MKKRLQEILLALILLTANVVFAAPEDVRFYGGINDGYDKNYVLDALLPMLPEDARFYGGINDGYDQISVLNAPVPASGPRIKINGVPYERIKSINGANPYSIINGIRY